MSVSAPASWLDALLERTFSLRRGEARRAFAMFGYLMGVVSTFIIARNVRDTLLLSRTDLSILPFMYVAVAAAVAPSAYIYSRVANKARRDRVISASLLLFALVLATFYATLAAGLGGTAVYALLYVVVEIIGAITMIQFWTFAQDLYDAREAKRLFAFIGAGGVLSNVTCGFAIQWSAPILGADRLLLVAAATLLVSLALVQLIARGAQRELQALAQKPKRSHIGVKEDTQTVRGNRHLELIAGMVAITFVTVSIVDYQFKVAAKSVYAEAELSAFFGKFFAYTGIVASVMQFFVTGRLLERRGLVLSLSLLPAGLAAGALSMFIPGVGIFVAGVITKSAENIFRYTVNDASTQLLYVPVPAQLRARAKAFIDGILKPTSIGAAGLLLAILGRVVDRDRLVWSLAILELVLLGLWFGALIAIRREYLSALIKTLRKRRLDLSTAYRPLDDAKTVDVLRKGLESQAEVEVLASIDLAGALDADLRGELTALLGSGSKAVRLAALERLSEKRLMHTAPVRALLDDADEDVRAAAARAMKTSGRAPATDQALERLRDPVARVRAAAITALYDHADPTAVSEAHAALTALVASDSADDRLEAARALGSIFAPRVRAQLTELLADRDLSVRVQAIKSAGLQWSESLFPALLPSLALPRAELSVIRTLVEAGTSLEPKLLDALIDERLDLPVRRRLPKVIALTGHQRSLDVLMTLLEHPDTELLIAAARAAAKIRARLPETTFDKARLHAALVRKLSEAYQILAAQEELALSDGELLHEALHTRYRTCLRVAFRLLGIRYASKTLQLVYRNLEADTKAVRANGIEVADNLLGKEESRLLLPLLEDRSSTDKVRVGRALFELEPKSGDAWLRTLLAHPHPWIVTCTLRLVGDRRAAGLRDGVLGLEGSGDPVIRETAAWALARLRDE